MTTTPCQRSFDEELLSGHLDGVLTQADAQRVRLHLEDCPACRTLVEELSSMREATRSTHFVVPADEQWNELPKGVLSRWSLRAGWGLLGVWALAVVGFVLWQVAVEPVGLFERVLVFSGLAGGGLLFLSVLLDRLKSYKTDRYRRIER